MDLKQLWSCIRPVSLTMFVFGLLVWLYTVAIQIAHPQWLSATLTHYRIPPFNCRVDDVGILSFAIAAFGFFVWRLETGKELHQT